MFTKLNLCLYKIIVIFLIFFIAYSGVPSQACTLWGATGKSAKNKGTIIVKNRDWKPDHRQTLRMVKSSGKFIYFGLYAEGNSDPGLKAGINEKGLTIITASASSIPKKIRKMESLDKKGIMKVILSEFSSVDEVLSRKDIISSARPVFFMIADREKIALIEVGLDGKFAVKTVTDGTIGHTNHYLDKSLDDMNSKTGKSSLARMKYIEKYLSQLKKPAGLGEFKRISSDQSQGPDESLWRTGSGEDKEITLSTWIVELPGNGTPVLYVKLANPGEPSEEFTYTLDKTFWQKEP